MEQIVTNKILYQPEYSFLHDKNILNKSLFVVLGGSYSYGTNRENSDIDLRIPVFNTKEELFGLIPKFNSWEDDKTDTVIYGLEKYIERLVNCNPNTLENLGCEPEAYLYITDEGRLLIENKELFLSKRVVSSFGKYANSQYNKMINAITEDKTQQDKENAMARSLDSLILSFNEKYKTDELRLSVDMKKSDFEELENEIVLKGLINELPLRQVESVLSQISNLRKRYDKLNHRNNKKTKEGLSKHMEHLLRLMITGADILNTGTIHTYIKGDEHQLLMDTVNGRWTIDEKHIHPEFSDIVKEWELKLKEAEKNTSLPDSVNEQKIRELVYELNTGYLKRYNCFI